MSVCLPRTEFEDKYNLLVKQVINEWQRTQKSTGVCVCVCVCIFSVIIIPMKSRFLNPAAQADTLNKIILIPHGKRNENEEINMEGRGSALLSLCL